MKIIKLIKEKKAEKVIMWKVINIYGFKFYIIYKQINSLYKETINLYVASI